VKLVSGIDTCVL